MRRLVLLGFMLLFAVPANAGVVYPNSPPGCQPSVGAVRPGETRTFALDCWDTDAGDHVSYVDGGPPPAHGSVGPVSADGHITYTAPATAVGLDTFMVVVHDDVGAVNAATLHVLVHDPPNHAPLCKDTAISAWFQLGFPLPCVDEDDDPLTYEIVTPPDSNALTLGPDGGAYSRLEAGPEETAVLRATDRVGASTTFTLRFPLTIDMANMPPTCEAPRNTFYDLPTADTLFMTCDSGTFELIDGPNHGTLAFEEHPPFRIGSYTRDPALAAPAFDSATYRIVRGNEESRLYTQRLIVVPTPTATSTASPTATATPAPAPALGVRVLSTRLKKVTKRGLRLALQCSTGCPMDVALRVNGRAAGSATGVTGKVAVKLTLRARKKLLAARKPKIAVAVIAAGATPATMTAALKR